VVEPMPLVNLEDVYYRENVYYEGTSFANKQGIGAHLSSPTQVPSLAWPELPELPSTDGSLLAVPTTLLYDRGQLISKSLLLGAHLPDARIMVNPQEAGRLNIAGGAQVKISLDGAEYPARFLIDEQVPVGVGLVPRSLGIPIDSPREVAVVVDNQSQESA
jgi:predicted molibdopterin-dependent oxidoreductase YjgC